MSPTFTRGEETTSSPPHGEQSEQPPRRTRRISWSQISQQCDLRLKFHRQRVEVSDPLGIGMLAGRAFHKGIELAKERGLDPADAAGRAVRALRLEIEKAPHGVRWDELERNQDGSLSAKSVGKLDRFETAEYWLRRQLPAWLEFNSELKIHEQERRILVPFTAQAHWKYDWELIAYLDLIDEADWIRDVKWVTEDFDASDMRKYEPQAHLYMAGFRREFKRPPAGFEFQVVVRGKEPVTYPDARDKAEKEAGKSFREGQDWTPEQIQARINELMEPDKRTTGIYRHVVPWDPAKINVYLNGMIKPRINVIEAEAFAASPAGWWCSEKFCSFHSHCAFGTGTNL